MRPLSLAAGARRVLLERLSLDLSRHQGAGALRAAAGVSRDDLPRVSPDSVYIARLIALRFRAGVVAARGSHSTLWGGVNIGKIPSEVGMRE